jgi:hypothetical protein
VTVAAVAAAAAAATAAAWSHCLPRHDCESKLAKPIAPAANIQPNATQLIKPGKT